LTIFRRSGYTLFMPFPIIPGLIEFCDGPYSPEPTNMIAGDTLAWQRSFEQYPASAGWTLTYLLNNSTARYIVNSADITTTADTFVVAIPSTETKLWTPGNYQWNCVAQLPAAGAVPAQRFTVALGRVIVTIDLLDASSPQDTRSRNEINLYNVEEMIAGRGVDGVQEYTINGRMLRRYSLTELMQLRSLYKTLVKQERANRGEYELPTRVAIHF
jgi:hypothetical protein